MAIGIPPGTGDSGDNNDQVRTGGSPVGRGRSLLSKMRLGIGSSSSNMKSKPTSSVLHDLMFSDLYEELKVATPSTQLSYSLKSRLERVERSYRRSLVSRKKEGCSPLFIACKKGIVNIVEYLISVCNADVEQKGLYEVKDDRSVHNVTPLWCASVAGTTNVVEALVRHGANVNCMSDTGSTPVRSACFMTHIYIVKLLVNNNADIQRSNYNGGTCLINSVQSVDLCQFLLQNGANVNAQDIQCKTALHYAIQEHRFETTKLLLSYGADPLLQSRYGDDALQTTALKGAVEIFQYLTSTIDYSAERVASAFELLGSTFIDEHHDSQQALYYWRAACQLREKADISKPIQLPKKQFKYTSEFFNRSELDTMSLDIDCLRLQSLIICERILGVNHKDLIYRLMYRGAAYADSLQFGPCIDLWKYALELRISKDTLLYCDTCFTAQALVKLFLDLSDKHSSEVKMEDVIHTLELLLSDLTRCSLLLEVAPVNKRQQDSWDKMLRILSHLTHLMTQLESKSITDVTLRKKIHKLVHVLDPRTSQGDSLLHLAVSKNTSLKLQNLLEDGGHINKIFPSLSVTSLLLECGARLNSVNLLQSTPLHTASNLTNFNEEIVELLLRYGAHIDSKNIQGVRPSHQLSVNPSSSVSITRYTSLACLCAQVVTKYNLTYRGEIPEVLESFVEDH